MTKTGLSYYSYNYLLKVVDVLALQSLSGNVDAGVDFSFGNHWQVSRNVVSEGSETADVHTMAGPEVVVKVGDQGFPDNKHLGFGFNWLLDVSGAFSGVQVLSGVLISIIENPIK